MVFSIAGDGKVANNEFAGEYSALGKSYHHFQVVSSFLSLAIRKKKKKIDDNLGRAWVPAHTTMIIPTRHTHKHSLFLRRSHSDIVCKEHAQPHTNAPPTDDCKLFPITH